MPNQPGEWWQYVQPESATSPYVHWFFSRTGPTDAPEDPNELPEIILRTAWATSFSWEELGEADAAYRFLSFRDPFTRNAIAASVGNRRPTTMNKSSNPNWQKFSGVPENWEEPVKTLPKNNNIDVIVGVIDSDIPLGHRAFRDARGQSRVLAAWQMGGDFAGQEHLPYGRELLKPEIDELLHKHSVGGLKGSLDEAAFNDAAGLVNMCDPLGAHALAGRDSHGACVLDLAAGSDPTNDNGFAQRVGIIVVTLPPRRVFGESGEFLDLFMMLAIQRIADVSRAYWALNNPDPDPETIVGYPTVVNLSFGRQAASKSADIDLFPRFLRTLRDQTASKAQAANLDVIMPAGNDNLAQVNAEYRIKPGKDRSVTWHLQPSDQSDNFLEIWARNTDLQRREEPDISIGVGPAGQELDLHSGRPGEACDIGDGVRLYRILLGTPDAANEADLSTETDPFPPHVGYLLATGPTEQSDRDDISVQSGAWQIRIKNNSDADIYVRLSIQTDQSVLPNSKAGRRSYFGDRKYQRFDESGRLNDAVVFDRRRWVRRGTTLGLSMYGTINASAAHKEVVCVGGYRETDGMPVSYSATGTGRAGLSRGAPTASLPSEDGYAHPGLLSACATDGGRTIMRGTSFASALATRTVVESCLVAIDCGMPPAQAWEILQDKAQTAEKADRHPFAYSDGTGKFNFVVPKLGYGRIPRPKRHVVPRFGER